MHSKKQKTSCHIKIRLITHAFSILQGFCTGGQKRIYMDTCRQQNHVVPQPGTVYVQFTHFVSINIANSVNPRSF